MRNLDVPCIIPVLGSQMRDDSTQYGMVDRPAHMFPKKKKKKKKKKSKQQNNKGMQNQINAITTNNRLVSLIAR